MNVQFRTLDSGLVFCSYNIELHANINTLKNHTIFQQQNNKTTTILTSQP